MIKRRTPPRDPGPRALAIDAWVDAVAIEGSAVRRRDGGYAALVEVEGTFFSLLAPEEQDDRVRAYGRVLNGLPDTWDVQVTLFVEPTDVSGYLDQMARVADALGEDPLGAPARAQLELATELSGQVWVERTVITVTGRNAQEAADRAAQVRQGLKANGFGATVCDADRLGTILQLAFGHAPVAVADALGGWQAALRRPDAPPAAAADPAPRRAGSGGAVVTVVPDAGTAALGAHVPRLVDVIRPAAWVEQPDALDLGGVWAATLVAVAWPDQMQNGWLDRVLHFDAPGVRRRVSFHLRAIPAAQAVAELNRKLVDLDANARWAARRGLRADLGTELALEDADELRQAIGRGLVHMFDTTLLVTLLADDRTALRAAVTRLRQDAAGFGLALRDTYLDQAPAFRATVPLGVAAFRRVRPVPTWPLAVAFPFPAGELLHDRGDLWGVNLSTGNAVILDPRRYQPGHLVVVAKTRSGKSFVIKVLATHALWRGDEDVLIIDPSPPIDYARWTRLVGGTYARFGPGSPDRLNPCAILVPPDPTRVDEDLERPVTAKVAFLTTLLALMAYPDGDMPPAERARLETPLYALYERFGFTDDWASVVDRSGVSVVPRAKRPPTLRDVLDAVADTPGLEDLALRIRPFVQGTLDMFSGDTTAGLDTRCVVFNVHGLVQGATSQHLQAVAYAIIAEHVRWRLAAAARRAFVVVDEAHIMFQRPDTGRFMAQLYRMAGKQGGRVALLTQGITDLVGDATTGERPAGEREARTCLVNSGLTVLLRNDKGSDLRVLQQEFGLTDAEIRLLREAEPGQALLLAGDDRVMVQVTASSALYPWLTTRPEEVQAFAEAGVYGDAAPGAAAAAGV